MPDTRRRAQNFWAALFVAALHIAVFSLLPARIKISMPESASEFEYVFIKPPGTKNPNGKLFEHMHDITAAPDLEALP